VIDLDPGPRAKFERVIEVAEFVKHELDALGLHAALKTSGATGLPSSLAMSICSSSGGRARLPVWVVKIRSVLRFIGLVLFTDTQ